MACQRSRATAVERCREISVRCDRTVVQVRVAERLPARRDAEQPPMESDNTESDGSSAQLGPVSNM